MNYTQDFHIKQVNHEMWFNAYDIEFVEKIAAHNVSRIYVPECENIMCYGKKCLHIGDTPRACVNCDAGHYQELYIDGWHVGNKYGWLTENDYVATLQTGIRVPVPKEVYDAWKIGFSKEDGPPCEIYELR